MIPLPNKFKKVPAQPSNQAGPSNSSDLPDSRLGKHHRGSSGDQAGSSQQEKRRKPLAEAEVEELAGIFGLDDAADDKEKSTSLYSDEEFREFFGDNTLGCLNIPAHGDRDVFEEEDIVDFPKSQPVSGMSLFKNIQRKLSSLNS